MKPPSSIALLAVALGLLAVARPAQAHHPAGASTGPLALDVVDRKLALHYRLADLEIWGAISPPAAAEGQELTVTFRARRGDRRYQGPGLVALVDRLGARREVAVLPAADGAYRAQLRADLPDGGAILLELPGAGNAVVAIPYEVRARLPLEAYLGLGVVLLAAGLLLAGMARAARASTSAAPSLGGDVDGGGGMR